MSPEHLALRTSAPLSPEQQIRAACYGIEARCYFGFRSWNEIEPELGACWRRQHEAEGVSWLEASEEVHAAWSRALPGDVAFGA